MSRPPKLKLESSTPSGERIDATDANVCRSQRVRQKHFKVLSAVCPAWGLSEPDDIEDEVRKCGFLDFSAYDVIATGQEVLSFFIGSPILKEMGFADDAKRLKFGSGRLEFGTVKVNSYFASAVVDFLRQKLLERKVSFTFETVMSHPGKVNLLAQAQASGFRTYLYFVATDDPAINVSRVRNRVQLGGHAVPPDRIESRYHRSLDLLMDAIRHTNRAYIFDNSTDNANGKQSWLAEITEGRKMELKTNEIPAWFRRAVLDKIK